MAKDPVCGIALDNTPHKSTYAGQIRVFCCLTCKTTFDKEPWRYAVPPGVLPVSYRTSLARFASTFAIASSIGHFFQVVLSRSVSSETRGRRA
jgi:YHS domain-containing protein